MVPHSQLGDVLPEHLVDGAGQVDDERCQEEFEGQERVVEDHELVHKGLEQVGPHKVAPVAVVAAQG